MALDLLLKKKYSSLPVQIKASFWFLMCSFFQKGVQVITTPIYTRVLTTEEFGEYNVFNSWLSVLTVFISMRIYFGVYSQGLIKFHSEKKVFSSSMQGLTFTLEVFWIIIYLLFKDFWNSLFGLSTVQMIILLLMVWTTAIFNFWATEKRVDYNYRSLIFVTCLTSVFKPIVAVFLVFHSTDKATALVAGFLIVEFICYIGMFFEQLYAGKTFYSSRFWPYAIALAIPLIPHYLSQTILINFDRIMIKKMIGSSEAGIYGLAYSISQVMSLFNTALSQSIEPWLFRKIKEKEIEKVGIVVYPSLIFVACVNLLLILIAPEVVRLFAPEPYYDAIWIIPPVVMSVYFGFMYLYFADFEFYFEKTKYITVATVTVALLNIILNYIFIKLFGYYAAGYTTLGCYILYACFHFLSMEIIRKKFTDYTSIYNMRLIAIISGIFVGVGFALMSTYNYPIVRYSVILIVLILLVFKSKSIWGMIKGFCNLRK